MNRVAFNLPDVGLREIKGLVYIDDGFLVLRIEDALAGIVDKTEQIIKIEANALNDLSVKRGVFKDRLVIEPKTMDLLDLVPGTHPTAVELRVWRKYREDLERLVEEFEELIW